MVDRGILPCISASRHCLVEDCGESISRCLFTAFAELVLCCDRASPQQSRGFFGGSKGTFTSFFSRTGHSGGASPGGDASIHGGAAGHFRQVTAFSFFTLPLRAQTPSHSPLLLPTPLSPAQQPTLPSKIPNVMLPLKALSNKCHSFPFC